LTVDRWCWECGIALPPDQGRVVALETWSWDAQGVETYNKDQRELMCEECASEFEEPTGELSSSD
jgi:hypothetical protein